jgi:glyoxylase-like metal-dependent hydrolase (beta-lactamase superfamily II)
MKGINRPRTGLENELARPGMKPADIRYALHTHLHMDHVGKDDIFPTSTTVVVNRRELQVAVGHGLLCY